MTHYEKHLFILGGPNGAGKSTFARSYLLKYECPFLNTDYLAEETGIIDPATAAIAAGKIFLQQGNSLISSGESLILESTLSGKYLEKLLHKARLQGYQVSMVFVFLKHPEECIERIKVRVSKGPPHS